MAKMLEEVKYCKNVIKYKFNKPLKMTEKAEINFKKADSCHICNNKSINKDIIVRDHCHITGKYRGSAHQDCNLNYIVVVGLLRSKSTMETGPYHCQFVVLRSKQCRLWLMRPMREWQSSLHEEQMLSRCGGVSCCFLFSPGPFFDGFVGDLLFTFLQLLMEEAALAAAVCCNIFPALGAISKAFISRLHTSLYLSCGRPRGRLPTASSPWRMSLGILPSSMRRTWPIQRILRCLSSVYMVERLARSRTSVLGTLSFQLMPRMRRRLCRWKLISLRSCLL